MEHRAPAPRDHLGRVKVSNIIKSQTEYLRLNLPTKIKSNVYAQKLEWSSFALNADRIEIHSADRIVYVQLADVDRLCQGLQDMKRSIEERD